MKVYLAFTAALALTGSAFQAKAAEPMSFNLMPLESSSGCESQCAQAIVADGEIVDSTPQEFLSFISSNLEAKVSSVVLLNSPGGKVVASMQLGQAFRKRDMITIVAGVEFERSGCSGRRTVLLGLRLRAYGRTEARHPTPEQGRRPPHVPVRVVPRPRRRYTHPAPQIRHRQHARDAVALFKPNGRK